MTAPPAYPRMPHLVAGRGTRDDLVLEPAEVADLLAQPTVVEEKVDGANVVLWLEDGRVECSLRSGPGAMDRAGQLGPLRAWAGQHDEQLRAILADDVALYGEWLFLTHTVAYDRLPSYLVALDLWRPDVGFLSVEDRDTACAESGLTTPPRLWQGVAGGIGAVEHLLSPSAWGPAPMEGLVVRSLERPDLRAKLLTTAFERIDDDEWRGGRPRNRLADEAASWR